MKLLDFKGVKKLSEITDVELMKDIQYRLGVDVDGIYGPDTRAAFVKFKASKHLGEPELLGESTARELVKHQTRYVSETQAKQVFGRSLSAEQLQDLNECLRRFDITTPARIRHFMAQIAHESGGLRWLKELATGDAYQGRRDLGNMYPGDGRRYKGGGALQLTGRYNYDAFGKYINDPNVIRYGADYVARKYPFSSAGFWWLRNRMNELVDSGATVAQVTRRVNGGFNGLKDRQHYFAKANRTIGDGLA